MCGIGETVSVGLFLMDCKDYKTLGGFYQVLKMHSGLFIIDSVEAYKFKTSFVVPKKMNQKKGTHLPFYLFSSPKFSLF